MNSVMRVVIADDERPARAFLAAMLRSFEDVKLVGEAEDGAEAIELIERERPDLALLDLQMPEIDGLGVVRVLKQCRPLIVFVTAYDEYAVSAFELNAVDYLLKPLDKVRLREAINRAQERLESEDLRVDAEARLDAAAESYEEATRKPILQRLPVRRRNEIVIVPVQEIASIVADGEVLRVTTAGNETYTIVYRLKDLETRLDPERFVRLGRGVLANVEMLRRVNPMPGGTYVATLSNGQQLTISRLQGRILRDQLLRL
jgi:two-component system LytT family response regulator